MGNRPGNQAAGRRHRAGHEALQHIDRPGLHAIVASPGSHSPRIDGKHPIGTFPTPAAPTPSSYRRRVFYAYGMRDPRRYTAIPFAPACCPPWMSLRHEHRLFVRTTRPSMLGVPSSFFPGGPRLFLRPHLPAHPPDRQTGKAYIGHDSDYPECTHGYRTPSVKDRCAVRTFVTSRSGTPAKSPEPRRKAYT